MESQTMQQADTVTQQLSVDSSREMGKNTQRKTEAILEKIKEYKVERPLIDPREVMKKLIKDGVCTHQTIADSQSIQRVLHHLSGRKEIKWNETDPEVLNQYYEDYHLYSMPEHEKPGEFEPVKVEEIFSKRQIKILTKELEGKGYGSRPECEDVADKVGTHYELVEIWCRNYLNEKYRKEAEEREKAQLNKAEETQKDDGGAVATVDSSADVDSFDVRSFKDEDEMDESEEEEEDELEEVKLTEEQIEELVKVFRSLKFPDIFAREELSEKFKVPETQIRKWFFDRRAKAREERNTLREQRKKVVNTDFSTLNFVDQYIRSRPRYVLAGDANEKDKKEKGEETSEIPPAMKSQLEKMRAEAMEKKKQADAALIEVQATLAAIDEMEKAFKENPEQI